MENLLWYTKQAECFEEALPIGNGKLGAMVYGRTNTEKISLNVDTLWSGHPYDESDKNKYDLYLKMKEAFGRNERKQAEDILESGFAGPNVQAYLPAGVLYVTIGEEDNVQNYRRELCLENGIAQSSFETKSSQIKSECFASGVDDVIIYKITASQKHDFAVSLFSELKNKISNSNDEIILSGQAYDERGKVDSYERNDTIKYTIALKLDTDGKFSSTQEGISITNATELTIYISIKTSFVDWKTIPNAEHTALATATAKLALKKGYETVKKEHIVDFSSFYNRIKTDFGDQKSLLPTDLRMKDENKDAGVVELFFNFGRYLIISSSRIGSLATNLQGIWNEKINPMWGSDFTININTQMNYWPVLMCNLPEFMVPLIELIKNISDSGKIIAKTFYNCDGFVLHHNCDIWAKATPTGLSPGGTRWLYWNMGAGWMCRHLFEYYEYTNDIDFLKNTALPIMMEAAKFYMNIIEKIDGKMVISPSTSPENAYMYNAEAIFLARYTTMTQAILIDLFGNIEKACEISGVEPPKLYSKEELCTYTIGSKGQLLEYDDEYEEQNPVHSHVSHLYGLYPGEDITVENKEIAGAIRKTLEIRGDEGSGWSMSWKSNLWAKLKDGNHALKLIKNQLKLIDSTIPSGTYSGGTYINMFDAHPPFQIDGNFGATAGIAHMFLQCENSKIKILPAIPNEFKDGSIEGLLAKGNVIVNIWWENNKFKKAQLISDKNQKLVVEIQNNRVVEVSLFANKMLELT